MNNNTLSHEAAGLALALLNPLSPAAVYQAIRGQGSALQLLHNNELLATLLTPQDNQRLLAFVNQGESSELGAQIAAIQARLGELQAYLRVLGGPDYPEVLARAHDAPAVLYLRGNPNAIHLPGLAIVGARHCTAQGGENAERFARDLAKGGFCIVSGLAAGVDGRAHRGALSGGGATIAVMATGIDAVYPARHRGLADEILANNGTLITEFPLGSQPLRAHFPQRNRIISGLSLGVLVVEAKVKSGSLITARTACAQNREVFAIPGSIHNPMAKGCHQLIKDGAKLVESTDDIFTELSGLLEFKQTELELETQAKPSIPESPILDALAFDAKTLEELAAVVPLSIEELMVEVLNLELAGLVVQIDGQIERVTF